MPGPGVAFEVFSGEDDVVMANVRFLAQGRRSMYLDEACVSALAVAGQPGMTIGEVEDAVRGCDPMHVRARSLSLLWRQVWSTDLRRPLSARSVISATADQGPPWPLAS